MANIVFSTFSSDKYAQYFNKKFLTTALEDLCLAKYADKQTLPAQAGSLTMRMFKRSKASASTVTQVTTEGQSVAYNNSTLQPVDVVLNEYYDASQISRRANLAEIFNNIEKETLRQGEAAAQFVEVQLRNAICATYNPANTVGNGAITANRLYAQGAANLAALNTAGTTNGKLTCKDVKRMVTRLKNSLAPKLKLSSMDGKLHWQGYIVVVSHSQASDLQDDPDWKLLCQHTHPELMQTGEVGQWAGAKIIETSLPFIIDGGGTDDVYVANPSLGQIVHTAVAFGQEAFAAADLATAGSAMAPKVKVLDQPDKSDPLNQWVIVCWDAYFGQLVLDPNWVVLMKSVTTVQ